MIDSFLLSSTFQLLVVLIGFALIIDLIEKKSQPDAGSIPKPIFINKKPSNSFTWKIVQKVDEETGSFKRKEPARLFEGVQVFEQ